MVDSLTSLELPDGTRLDSELHGTNGSATVVRADKQDYQQFLHLLRLSGDDGLEINRGRTEWRKKAPR